MTPPVAQAHLIAKTWQSRDRWPVARGQPDESCAVTQPTDRPPQDESLGHSGIDPERAEAPASPIAKKDRADGATHRPVSPSTPSTTATNGGDLTCDPHMVQPRLRAGKSRLCGSVLGSVRCMRHDGAPGTRLLHHGLHRRLATADDLGNSPDLLVTGANAAKGALLARPSHPCPDYGRTAEPSACRNYRPGT